MEILLKLLQKLRMVTTNRFGWLKFCYTLWMNKPAQWMEIREVKIQCSICAKDFITKISPNKTYKGGNFFGKIGDKGKKVEYWECDKCYKS